MKTFEYEEWVMKKTFCDICDKEIDPFLTGRANGFDFILVSKYNGREYDLCPSCEQKLKEFIKEIAR